MKNEFTIPKTKRQKLLHVIGFIAAVAMFPLTCAGIELACGAGEHGRAALEKAGFQQITIGGRSWFTCDRNDSFASHFTAVNTAGRRVSGVVCCNVAGACSIKY